MLALIVDPFHRDHVYMRRVLRPLRCDVVSAYNRAQGQVIRTARRPSLIVCESDLPDGCWRDFLRTASGPGTPLIVTSRLADERLWAEVLKLGGHDVLAKPFEEPE